MEQFNNLAFGQFKLLVITLALAFSVSAEAKFYKWTDENGKTHYSDKVPDNVENSEGVKVNAKASSDAGASQQKLEARRKQWYDDAESGEKSAKEKADEKAHNEALSEYCNSVSSNIKALQQGGRSRQTDKDGKVTYLDDKKRQDMLKDYQAKQKDKCSGM